MALTSPDNVWTPDASDDYALTTDLSAMADSVQLALSKKANYGVGTTAERTSALADFADGAVWFDTTLGVPYRRVSGAWVEIEEPGSSYNYIWANAAARGSQAGMVAGELGYQTDTAVVYRYSGSAWVAWGVTGGSITLDGGVTATVNQVERNGRVASVTVSATRAAGWSTDTTVGVLPAEYRPSGTVYSTCVTFGTGSVAGVQITTDGTITVIAPTAGHTVLGFTLSFVAV